MKENKNIERLFQEKFKDFEVSPPDFVWENIQEKLNPKEKKRRVIPFWFKTAGIAASFVAIVSVIFYNTSNDINNGATINNNAVVNSDSKTENKNSNQNVGTVGNDKFNTSNSNKNQNNSNATFINETGSNSESNSFVTNNTTNSNSANTVSNSKTGFKSNQNATQNAKNSNNGFVSNHNKQSKVNHPNTFNKNKTLRHNSNSGIVATQNNTNKSTTNKLKSNTSKSGIIDINSFKNNDANSGLTDINSVNKSNSSKNNNANSGLTDVNTITKLNTSKNKEVNSGLTDVNAIDKLNTSKNNNANTGLTDINSSNKSNTSKNTDTNSGIIDVNAINNLNSSKNNTDVLVENGSENGTTNSTAIVAIEEIKIDTITLAMVTIEENAMEKLLREKETKEIVDEKEKWSKWAVNSYVSPVFFNSFESGSPVSEEFASNEKSFNNSTSYGVGVAYNLNKRFSIKTGVSNLNLDYDTENIAFYSSFEDQSRIANTNIERNTNGRYLVLKNEKDNSKNLIENQVLQTGQNTGTLNQKTQYIEVPLELSYAILNKKFGVAIKGGMSTLFLTENVISIDSNDGNMQIGKASNLNNVHFSSNLGLGLSYSFMKNFQLNLEPTLKYQINTFNKNSEDFSPYVIGVNTGISYKF